MCCDAVTGTWQPIYNDIYIYGTTTSVLGHEGSSEERLSEQCAETSCPEQNDILGHVDVTRPANSKDGARCMEQSQLAGWRKSIAVPIGDTCRNSELGTEGD